MNGKDDKVIEFMDDDIGIEISMCELNGHLNEREVSRVLNLAENGKIKICCLLGRISFSFLQYIRFQIKKIRYNKDNIAGIGYEFGCPDID